MKPISVVLAEISDDEWFNYEKMVESIGHESLVWVDIGQYQGDTLVMLRDGDRYGLLAFGWGSCCGCDALQACGGKADDLEKLRDELATGIVWRDSRSEMIEFLKNRDWDAQWYGRCKETDDFVKQAVEKLEAVA